MDSTPKSNNPLIDAWNLGAEIGHDITQSKLKQREIVALRVKSLRTAKGISQEQISNMSHANTLTYRGYENCKSDIPLFYLVRIANVLETSLDYLAGRTDIQEPDSLESRIKKLEEIVLKQNSNE